MELSVARGGLALAAEWPRFFFIGLRSPRYERGRKRNRERHCPEGERLAPVSYEQCRRTVTASVGIGLHATHPNERPVKGAVPRFISRIARRTLLPLARLYLRAIVVTCWFHRDCVPYLRRSLTRSLRNSCRCAIANRVGWVSRLSDSSH